MTPTDKFRLWYLGALLAAPVMGWAQSTDTFPSTITRHYTAGFLPATTPDSTTFCAETTYRDTMAVTKVFYPSGQLKQYVPFMHYPRFGLHGTLTSWYENGQMQTKEDYVGGQRHGDLLTYYPNGALKRRERYTRGQGSVGTCYAANGAVVPFFIYEQLPLYPGGMESLQKELMKRMQLTSKEKAAMQKEAEQLHRYAMFGVKRSVHVELVVAEDGRIAAAEIVRSTAPFLNEAALRAAAALTRQFVPARRDGQLVKSHYTVPIFYTLHPPYRSPYPTRVDQPTRR